VKTDPLQILTHFDRWATDRLIESFRRLDPVDLDRSFEIGLGSIRKTFVHVVANMEWWLDRARCRPPRAFDSKPVSLDAIVQRYQAAWSELESMVSGSDPKHIAQVIDSEFDQPDGSKVKVRFPRSAVLLHVLNHGTHHRVQCLNMLRQLGVDPLPEIDLIDSNQETVDDHA
jgi:uncharacterized damage-inducible protein DinB